MKLARHAGAELRSARLAARTLRIRGFAIVWLLPGEKRPTRMKWTECSQEVEDYQPGANLGLMTGRLSRDLVCIDLDSRAAIELADTVLPNTRMVDGRPGKPCSHRWYLVSDIPPELTSRNAAGGIGGPWKKQFRRLSDNKVVIDFLGTGGQAVVPPSSHSSGEQRLWHFDGEPATVSMEELWTATTRLAERCGWSRPQPIKRAAPTGTILASDAEKVRRAKAYLATIEPAISGSAGGNRTFRAACKIVLGFDLNFDQAFDLLAEWNVHCKPMWTDQELRHKIEDAECETDPRGYLLIDRENSPKTKANQDQSAQQGRGIQMSITESGFDGQPPYLSVGELIRTYPNQRQMVIEGLLRVGETMNIVAPPKLGKSWLGLSLAMAVSRGERWLDSFDTTNQPVLIIDNELHPETLSHRLQKMAGQIGVDLDTVSICVANLRGRLQDLERMGDWLMTVEPGRFGLVIIDAFYRTLPKEMNENDNGSVAGLYNLVDRYAAQLQSAFALIHHTSKGSQSEKNVTDVGSGAGSQSRAADTHLVLRAHEEPNAVVLDAAVRSFSPFEPCCLRWDWPLWTKANDLDPAKLRQTNSRRKRKQEPERTIEGPWTAKKFAEAFGTPEPQPTGVLIEKAVASGRSERQAKDLLKRAVDCGHLHRWRAPGQANSYLVSTKPPNVEPISVPSKPAKKKAPRRRES